MRFVIIQHMLGSGLRQITSLVLGIGRKNLPGDSVGGYFRKVRWLLKADCGYWREAGGCKVAG